MEIHGFCRAIQQDHFDGLCVKADKVAQDLSRIVELRCRPIHREVNRIETVDCGRLRLDAYLIAARTCEENASIAHTTDAITKMMHPTCCHIA